MSEEMMSARATCEFFGGDKPIALSTLYYGMERGRYPKPVKMGRIARWLRSECEAAKQRLISERNANV
jgi:predicted DNA-binding transcriptional regulator AlpA